MPRVIMTTGRICSGKSSYARALADKLHAVIFSVDEITLVLLGQCAGEKLDEYVEKLEGYFFKKTLQTLGNGVNVILDWGFWQRRERDFAREFFSSNGAEYEFHYIDIDDDEWQRRIAKRNESINAGAGFDYYVDEGLAKKAAALFEPIGDDEKDVKYIREE